MPDPPLRLFLVDDHPVVREGWRAQIGDAMEIVGEADEADAAIDLILERSPDVVLLDVHLPGGGGERIARQVRDADRTIRFLAVSESDARGDVVKVMAAGATGYLTKRKADSAELIEAIGLVAEGRPVFTPDLAGVVLELFDTDDPELFDPQVATLTDRELDVLRLIARAYTYKEIAEQLFIAPKTVEGHMSNILRKLQLANRHQLARWAMERGLA